MDKIVFCSGFIYFKLIEMLKDKTPNIAIARIEELAPFPMSHTQDLLQKFGKDKTVIWLQDENMNSGAFQWALPHLQRAMRRLNYKSTDVQYIGKPSLHTIAYGSSWGYK